MVVSLGYFAELDISLSFFATSGAGLTHALDRSQPPDHNSLEFQKRQYRAIGGGVGDEKGHSTTLLRACLQRVRGLWPLKKQNHQLAPCTDILNMSANVSDFSGTGDSIDELSPVNPHRRAK